jgi:bisanhydrobacterioruberin hydratase
MKKALIARPEPSKAIKIVSTILLVGIIGFAIPYSRPIFQSLTPFVIILSILGALHFHDGDRSFKMIFVSLFVFIAGLSIEIIGVNTGLVFGHYTYGHVLGPKVFETPIIIGLNWFLLIYTSRALVEYWDTPEIVKVITAAILVTALDIVLEPVAIHLGFWTWDDVIVPLQNYFAWFGIAFIFSGLFSLSKVRIYNEMGGPLFFLLFMFFLILNSIIFFIDR